MRGWTTSELMRAGHHQDRQPRSEQGSHFSGALLELLERTNSIFVLTDATGMVVYANRAGAELFGSPFGGQPLSLQQSLGELSVCEGDGLTPLPVERFPVARALQGEVVLHLAVLLRYPLRPQGMHATLHATPIRGREQQIVGVALMGQDVTSFHQIRSERDEIFRLSAAPMATLAMDGRFVSVNPAFCQLIELSLEELRTGMTLMQLVRPEEVERTRLAISQLASGDDRVDWEVWVCSCKGEERRIHWAASADRSADRIYLVGADLSESRRAEAEKRRLEEQMRHAQKLEAIGQLAAGIAHEINTPTQYAADNVRFIAEYAEQLDQLLGEVMQVVNSDDLAASDIRSKLAVGLERFDAEFVLAELPVALNQTLDGLKRIADIVRAMKEFSHPGGNEKAPADINKIVENTIAVSANEWKYVAYMQRELTLELPTITVHGGEIGQVLLNLIINAAQSIAESRPSGEKGHITVKTYLRDDAMAIEVIDDGAGIPEAIRHRVFDPFFTTKQVGKGTGQGLAIVHNVIVERHGGSVEFESAVDKGTCMRVLLPHRDRETGSDSQAVAA